MEDPWGNAWSSADSEESGDGSKEILEAPKWNTFERDEDENTVDVGVPSWSTPSGSGWGDGSNLWHAESSALDVWKPSLNLEEIREEPDLKPEDEEGGKEQEKDSKSPELEPRPILPTPPLSPLSLSSTITAEAESSRSSPLMPSVIPPSPDHFGSFESAEVISNESNSSWTPKTPHFPSEATDEPWGAAWGGSEVAHKGENEGENDEWKLAQETKRKRNTKVPPELLHSLVKQWDEFAADLYPKLSPEHNEHASWRKGLDSIDGLAELVDSILPEISFLPPTPFNKSAVSKSVKETLRLTRSFPLTQCSPMAHFNMSKGSSDWEKSVKAQKSAANDEWGWDLKHEPEEIPAAMETAKDKKSGGLLSFWSRKASSPPGAPVGDSPTASPLKSPTILSKPTSPLTSARPSIDSFHVASPSATTSTNPPLLSEDVDVVLADVPPAQPSAVSRFLNRFSRKPSAGSAVSSGQEKHTSVSLSDDDLSFLSNMTPSTTEGSLQSSTEPGSISSLGAMLSWPTKNSSPSSSKLPPPLAPPPLAPPPLHSSHSVGHKSANSLGSDTSFDAEIGGVQLMHRLDQALGGGPSSSSGYAPVIIDLEESEDPKTSPRTLPDPWIHSKTAPLSSLLEPPAITLSSTTRAQIPIIPLPPMTRDAPMVTSDPLPSIPPPRSPEELSRHPQSIALARFHNPLPPTPKRGLDDLEDFSSLSPLSGRSTPPHSPSLPRLDSSRSIKVSAATSLLASVSDHSNFISASDENGSADFGDFGDFISTPIRTPSPPKVPQKTFQAVGHDPVLELVEKGAARQGRWPAPPSPIPLPLAPPPGPSPNLGYFKSQQQPSQLDLLTSDDPPVKPPSLPGTFMVLGQGSAVPQPLFADSTSRPASTAFGMTPAPLPTSSNSQIQSTMFLPDTVSSKPTGGSGLSAQDLSFFEGL